MSGEIRIVIAGGGTGGHIYPAVSIAQALRKLNPHVRVSFVGSTTGLEAKVIPPLGFSLDLINVGKLNKSVGLGERIKTMFLMPISLIQCLFILRKIRPHFVLGVGGFASGPFVLIASLFGVPTGIWEPNAYPGLANRILEKFVEKVFVVFPQSAKFFKSKNVIPVGLPVRAQISARPHDTTAFRPFHVLIFGGSQGARAINKVVSEALTKDKKWYDDIEFVHQVGSFDYDWIEKKYAGVSPNIKYFRYLDDMEERYAWSDLVFCRGGISTISELAASQRAAVIIPLPSAADNHQQKNAEPLTRAMAACMILQSEFTPEEFKRTVLDLKANSELRETMEKNIKSFYKPNAADEISQLILREIK